jgi:DNA-binding MarR family transcriptional regulator
VKEKAELKDSREDLPIFIHSELDDYGLTPIEFRIYSRHARRAGKKGCMESVAKMAEGCKVSPRSVQLAVKLLLLANLIEREERPGETTIYHLTPRSQWADASQLDNLRKQVTKDWKKVTPAMVAPPEKASTPATLAPHPRNGCTPTPAMVAPKGTPVEGSPVKATTTSVVAARTETAVSLCRKITHRSPNEKQRQDITAQVKDLERWKVILDAFMLEGQPPQHVDWMLERYHGNGKAQSTHDPPGWKARAPTLEDLAVADGISVEEAKVRYAGNGTGKQAEKQE